MSKISNFWTLQSYEYETNLIWGLFSGLLSDGVAVPPDDLLLAEDGVIAGDLKLGGIICQ